MKTVVFCIWMALCAIPALAETYTWEDDQGTVNFTEDLGNVPTKYRKKVKIVGEEEFPPPEPGEGAATTAPKGKVERAGSGKEKAAASGKDKKKVEYGGKDAETWKSDFANLNGELKSAEKQLMEYRDRLKDTSAMSRVEYLGIQNTIKSLESYIVITRKKLDDLRKNAAAAGVPADLME